MTPLINSMKALQNIAAKQTCYTASTEASKPAPIVIGKHAFDANQLGDLLATLLKEHPELLI